MWYDPIVEELHKIRADHAAKFNYDLHALVQYYQQEQRCSLREIVSFANQQTESEPITSQEQPEPNKLRLR